VLDDALANLECKVQSGKFRIALLELLDDAQCVQIVVEVPAERAQELVQLLLAGMAEGRMPNVVNKSERFGEFSVQLKRAGNGARNLRDFERVR